MASTSAKMQRVIDLIMIVILSNLRWVKDKRFSSLKRLLVPKVSTQRGTQPAFVCTKLTIETPEQVVKYVQS